MSSSCFSANSFILITADDRVQLLLAGQIHQILTVFLQGVVGVLRVIRGHALVAAHGGKLLQKLVLGDAKGTEQLGGVLGRDVYYSGICKGCKGKTKN